MEVGIRELKSRLSQFVAAASGGEEIVVTDRGKPVARLVGLDGASAIERGVEQGWIEAPRRTTLSAPLKLRAPRSIASVLDEDRG